MALRYTGLIIGQAREETGETDFDDDNGVPQSVPIQALKEGVIHCQNSLYLAAPQIFDTITEIDAVANQIEYDLPANVWIGSGIAAVEYSASGEDSDYVMLALRDFAYRIGGTGDPTGFCPYGDGKLLIDPAPAQAGGVFRVTHGATLDAPELRRGKIESVTKDGGMENYTTIVLANDSNLDEDAIGENEYLCVNDKDGVVKYYNVYYTGYDSGTRTITLGSGISVEDGEIAADDYITVGKYTTTHVKLHPIAEPILTAFGRRRFYLGKSSDDVTAENDNIAAFTKEMVATYRRRVRTQKKIPYTGRFECI